MEAAAAAAPVAPDPRLLGPPEIRRSAAPGPPKEANAVSTGEPFVDLMSAAFNEKTVRAAPLKGLTENWSPTFLTSGDPCLDFFFLVVPGISPAELTHLLGCAWGHNPLTALKLVAHLRGVRGTGKSDKEGFYTAALWLHQHHPKTLALNLRSFADFGYLKDLLEILFRVLHDDGKRVKTTRSRRHRCGGGRGRARPVRRPGPQLPREVRIAAKLARMKIADREAARDLRKMKREAMAVRAVQRYDRDPDYRFLHDRVADLFAELLRADMENLRSGKPFRLSLAAKWCPSLDSSFDRSTLICESIARRVFPREAYVEYQGIEDQHYAYRVRDRLRKEVLVPLRRKLQLPEVYMGANQWSLLPYNRVASVAMKNYNKLFVKHDAARFAEYLGKVAEGKAKIAAGALLPHQILAAIREQGGEEVAELQWQRMVKDLSHKGKLRDCLAVCDVSGSMYGIPMEVCIALGMLISELSEEPWSGRVITFSREPELHRIEGTTLKKKMRSIENMDVGYNTDFQRVFDQILRVAVEGKLPADKMIKRLFVFSDMEFDEASTNSWETDYEAIQRKFGEHGYGSSVPEIVFWNLRSSQSVPVMGDQKGVALVSGFSKNMLKLFLEGEGVFTPAQVMEAAIAGKEFEQLAVFD